MEYLDFIKSKKHKAIQTGFKIPSSHININAFDYQAIKQGRKFVGSELKEAYFNVAVNNLKDAVAEKKSLFDEGV